MATPSVPGAITVPSGSLTGSELVSIATAGPQSAQTTTQAIANLAISGAQIIQLETLSTTQINALTTSGMMALSVNNFIYNVDTAGVVHQQVTADQVETLTNKTLTAPILSTLTTTQVAALTTSGIVTLSADNFLHYVDTAAALHVITTDDQAQTLTSKTITDAIQNGNMASTATLTATSLTTAAPITGLSYTATAGGNYTIRAHLNGTAVSGGGIKALMAGSAGISSSNITTWNWNGTTINAVTNQTSWGSALMSNTAVYTDLVMEGNFTCSTTGTVLLEAAQSAVLTTATTVAIGSTMTIGRIS